MPNEIISRLIPWSTIKAEARFDIKYSYVNQRRHATHSIYLVVSLAVTAVDSIAACARYAVVDNIPVSYGSGLHITITATHGFD